MVPSDLLRQSLPFKRYKRHASKEEPQNIIKSDKADHLAIHKGSALKKERLYRTFI